MLFVAHNISQKDAFLAKAREMTYEHNIKVRYAEPTEFSPGDRWVFTVSNLADYQEHRLGNWVTQEMDHGLR